jgi:hypothetical protein
VNELNKKTESTYTNKQIDSPMTNRVLMVVFGIIEVMLGSRFIFKLAGANPENTIIKMLYASTDFMVKIFANIFTPATSDGLETVSVIEPGTIIAMVVLALIALAISKLISQNTRVQKNTKEFNTVDHSTIVDKEEK